jgi:hypothetical protein
MSRAVRIRKMVSGLSALVLWASLLGVLAPASFADSGYALSSSFSSPGGFADPGSVAVNDSSSLTDPYRGDVYVVDQGHNAVDEFSASGTFLNELVLPNPGPYSSLGQLVVDGYPSLSGEGDVYVIQTNPPFDKTDKMYRLSPGLTSEEVVAENLYLPVGVTVDAAGDYFVAQYYGDGLGEAGVFEYNANWEPANAAGERVNPGKNRVISKLYSPDGLAADAAGDIYIATAYEHNLEIPSETFRYRFSGGEYGPAETFDRANSQAVTVGPFGEVIVSQGNEFAAYEADGALLGTFGGGVLSGRDLGIGVGPSGSVYVSDYDNNVAYLFEKGQQPETPVTNTAEVSGVSATLHGQLNPGGAAGALEYRFDYNIGSSCTGGQSVPVPAGTVAEAKKALVEASVTGLSQGAHYTYCLVAIGKFGPSQGNEVTFATTAVSPTIVSEGASGGDSTRMNLQARINPSSEPTSYLFEYSTEAEGETLKGSIVTVDGQRSLPGEFAELTAGVTAEGLTPGTVYFYRVKATNATGTSTGHVESFTTVPTPSTDQANPVGETTTTLNGHFTLNATATEYYFTYKAGTSCTAKGAIETTPVEAGTGAGEAKAPGQISGLTPNHQYTVCLVTVNAFGSERGEPVSFTTEVAPPSILAESTSATEVAATSATVEAEVNPGGGATTYHFEYLTEAEFSADHEGFAGATSVPVPDASLGSGTENILALQHLQNLQPDTGYRYRIAVTSASVTAYGSSQTFTTEHGGGELQLPDARHWEMVSPPNKEGALIYPLGTHLFEALNVQGSSNGNAIVFMTNAPTEANPTGDGQASDVLGTRGASEWSTQVLTAPHKEGTGFSIGNGAEYRFFSEDLSLGLDQVFGEYEPLSPEATEQTPYLRTVYEHGDVDAHCASSCYKPLVTAANTPPGTEFGGIPKGGGCAILRCGPQFVGASRDLHHVLLTYDDAHGPPLTSVPVEEGLYEWGEGTLKLVSTLPADAPENGGESVFGALGEGGEDFQHVISDDGSRVIWATSVTPGLFLSDTSGSKVESLVLYPHRAHSVTASSDLSRIFFVGQGNLHEYNLNAPEGSRLTNLTESGGVGVVIGVSEDGEFVYYSANGELFEYHDGQTTSIAPANEQANASDLLESRTSRVSPNGHWLAFDSSASLTGYDTRDAVTGEPDEEVYLFNGETHKLVCASCNPTGALPIGRSLNVSNLVIAKDSKYGRVSALIPPWSRFNVMEARYQSRYLSSSGRLFFDSNEALVPQDVNGTMDVYQYEPPEVGNCTTSSATFSGRSGGCVGLISSGTSPQESSFLDASESGGDVFFLTTAKLQPQDVDNAYDVYDAHECSASEPCYPATPAQPPACDTSESCKAAESAQPEIFGSPSSETFSGAGNLTPSAPVVVKKTTRKKTLKCKRGFVKKRSRCVKQKSTKHTEKSDRRASR